MSRRSLIRCFIAVDVEDPQVVAKIEDIQKQLAALGLKAKFVEPYNLHITIKFLGEIPRPLVDSVINGMAELRFSPFKIRLAGLGAFPRIERPRVVWVGVTEGAEELESVYQQVRRMLAKVRIQTREEEFTPHLTIARVKAPPPVRVIDFLKNSRELDVGMIEVTEVRLKKSTLTHRGPIYETLFSAKATGKQ